MKRSMIFFLLLAFALAGCSDDNPTNPGNNNNSAPVITAGPTATPAAITDIQTTILSATATDADGDGLSYDWSAAQGSFTGTGSTVVYSPGAVVGQVIHTITLTVTDGNSGTTTQSVNVTVNHAGVSGAIGARYRVRLNALNFVNTDCDGLLDSTIEAFWNIQAGTEASVRLDSNYLVANSGQTANITTAWYEIDILFDGTGSFLISGTLEDWDQVTFNDLIASWNLYFDTNNIAEGSFSASGGNPAGEGCNVVLNYTIEMMNEIVDTGP